MKPDILFMTWNCAECCRLKIAFPEFSKYSFGDDEVGKEGQSLVVIYTYSNTAARSALREVGGFSDEVFTPAVLTRDGKKISDYDEILTYLKENYD